MNHNCDGCKGPIKEVGKLFKLGFMMLCKPCRMGYRKGVMGLSIRGRIRRIAR